jgi:hypothetical protein
LRLGFTIGPQSFLDRGITFSATGPCETSTTLRSSAEPIGTFAEPSPRRRPGRGRFRSLAGVGYCDNSSRILLTELLAASRRFRPFAGRRLVGSEVRANPLGARTGHLPAGAFDDLIGASGFDRAGKGQDREGPRETIGRK